jgi:hypothetical protein
LSFDIFPSNPAFVTFEGTNFNTVFSNIGHVQIGVSVPASLDALTSPLRFDLDSVSIVPEPGGWLLLTLGMMFVVSRSERRVTAIRSKGSGR